MPEHKVFLPPWQECGQECDFSERAALKSTSGSPLQRNCGDFSLEKLQSSYKETSKLPASENC